MNVNGIIAVPILSIIERLGNDRNILRGITNGIFSNVVVWVTFAIMAIYVGLFFIWIRG